MTDLIDNTLNWSFAFGLVLGIVMQRGYAHMRCRWKNEHHPRADGTSYRVAPIARTWVGGLIVLAVLGYVLVQVQQTHDDTVALAQRVTECNDELIASANIRETIRDNYDRLSVEQRNLLTELDDASGVWVYRLLNPPPHLADTMPSDASRQGYGLTVTRLYYERATELRARIAEIRKEQTALQQELADNPPPAPNCGR